MRARTASWSCLLPLLLLFTGCLSYQEVALVGVKDVQVQQLDATGLKARVFVDIRNPNNYRIKAKDPDVELFANDLLLGKAVLDSVISLDPNSTRTYSVPLHADFKDQGSNVLPVLMTAMLSQHVKVSAKGSVVGQAFLLRKRFPFEVEQVIDLSNE